MKLVPTALLRLYALMNTSDRDCLDLESTPNNGPYPKIIGIWSISLGALELRVCQVPFRAGIAASRPTAAADRRMANRRVNFGRGERKYG